MADESTAAVSQPPETEESQQGTPSTDYSSFLGPPSAEVDLSAEERPAPGAEQQAEGEPELSGEPEQEGEPQEEQEAEAEAAPEVEAEAEAEQPPSVEERLKDLTQRESDEYAQRYPSAWKALQDPKTPEDLKHLLLDKIDGDHEIQRRIAQEQALAEEEGEPTPEYEAEVPQTAAATPEAIAEQRTAYYSQIDNLVKTQFDPQSVKEVGDSLLRMFNVNVKALQDPNVSPEDKAVLQGLVSSVQREAPVLARFMADAVATVVPHVVRPAIEAAMPGFTEMYERQMYGNAYENVRAQTDERGRPLYPGLPAYPMVAGTPEAQAFADKMRAAAQEVPGFDEMTFRDKAGRLLPDQQQAQIKYTILLRHMAGQRVNPAVVAQAVETGRRLAGRADNRRAAARVAGAGQRTAGPPGRGGAEDEDPMLAALDAEISRQEVNYRQPVRGRSGR
jgi:hypothetical protein